MSPTRRRAGTWFAEARQSTLQPAGLMVSLDHQEVSSAGPRYSPTAQSSNVYLPHQCLLGGQLKDCCHLAELVIEGLQGDGWAGAGTHACRGLLQQGRGAGQHDEGLLQGSTGACAAQGSCRVVERHTGASCSRRALPDSMAEDSFSARWGPADHRAATAVHLKEQVEVCIKGATCCSSEAMQVR